MHLTNGLKRIEVVERRMTRQTNPELSLIECMNYRQETRKVQVKRAQEKYTDKKYAQRNFAYALAYMIKYKKI